MNFIDSHCHLEHVLFDNDRDLVISDTKNHLNFVIDCGGSVEENSLILKLSSSHSSFIFPAIGLAPHFYTEDYFKLEKQVLDNLPKVIALGEIGLDLHHFSRDTLDAQKKTFIKQLDLAEKLNLPVIIHSRKAELESIEILNSYNLNVQMHCFFEYSLLNQITFNHVISVPTLKSKDCDKTIEKTNLEYLVFETDSPFLWSIDGKFKRNEPKNVISVYDKASKIKKIPLEDICNTVKNNLNRIFTLL